MITAHKKSLEDLLLIAHAELRSNPTITRYVMVGGFEQRRIAHPFAAINYGIAQITDAIGRFTLGVQDLGAQMDKLLAPLSKAQWDNGSPTIKETP